MDPFEDLGIRSSQIKRICEKSCDQFGCPINYRDFCESDEVAASAHGPQMHLWRSVEANARQIICRTWGGGSDPSPFKVLAAVSCSILGYAPIPEFFPESLFRSHDLADVFQLPHAPAAVISIDFALRILHGSKVGEELEKLTAPLEISPHFYRDLVAVMTLHAKEVRKHQDLAFETTRVPFSLLSLAIEAVAYKTNPHAEHRENRIIFDREGTV